ncbi:hypothetical protein E4U41_006911 [Claviceps citrina]|nr:hypothetical protein E4U41_006911 [Claviceps citrina]
MLLDPDPPQDDDEQYASSQDSDFAPDAAPEPASDDESDSEDAAAAGAAAGAVGSSKRTHAETIASGGGGKSGVDAGYDNSGDEAIIVKGQKRRRRAQERGQPVDDDDDDDDDDDEGGQGGLVKTRAQRAAEKEERKYAVNNNEPVTIDVDAVWAQMTSGEPVQPSKDSAATEEDGDEAATTHHQPDNSAAAANAAASAAAQPDTIRIKRTYNFAGRVHTEEKIVARDSAEAALHLASRRDDADAPAGPPDASPARRATTTKKAFRSAFEPVLDTGPGRTDLDLGLAAARTRAVRGGDASMAQARKLTTVEKSRMDWAGYVDKEGIKHDLELARKSKDSYAARQDFLARSEARREDDARRARTSMRV